MSPESNTVLGLGTIDDSCHGQFLIHLDIKNVPGLTVVPYPSAGPRITVWYKSTYRKPQKSRRSREDGQISSPISVEELDITIGASQVSSLGEDQPGQVWTLLLPPASYPEVPLSPFHSLSLYLSLLVHRDLLDSGSFSLEQGTDNTQ
jgi:hypothetical protein